MIPALDFGGSGPALHFAHANGYPPRAYAPLIETLTPHYRVVAMLARPLQPNSSPNGLRDWTSFTDDLIQFLDERGEKGIFGVGHSLGAATTLFAALRRPDLFRAIGLIDPPLFSPLYSAAYGLARRWPWLLERLHPYINSTLRRQRVFANVQAMYQRYRAKPLFARVPDRGVRAYAEALARPRPDGQVELAYSPEWEVRIYESAPHDLWTHIDQLKVPLLLIYGKDSDTFRPAALAALKRRVPEAEVAGVEDAGHLVPLEKPDEVGAVIHEFLGRVERVA